MMSDICSFNSTCPCFDEKRCAKVEPNTDCIVRLIDTYKNLYNAHSKVLNNQLSVSAMWFPNCSPWGN